MVTNIFLDESTGTINAFACLRSLTEAGLRGIGVSKV